MELPKSSTGRAARTEAINKCHRLPGPPPLCRSQDSSPETRLTARTVWSDRSGPFLGCPSNPVLTWGHLPLRLPGPRCPPSSVTMLAGGRPSRGASRARLPEGWRLPGVYSCPSAAARLSRVLGRRSAPGSGNNCGPGVRQPFSRDRGPEAGTLRRPGTRAAEGSPVASGGRAPSEEPSVGPAGDVWTQRRSCLLCCGNCAAAPRMRTAAAAAAACLASSHRSPAKVMGLLCAAVGGAKLTRLTQPARLMLRTPRQEGADVSSRCLNLNLE